MYSVESSEIDLSEFQDENPENVDHAEREAEPSGAEPESTSKDAGWLIKAIIATCIFMLFQLVD